MGPSFRYTFIDIDSSQVTKIENTSTVKGFMVVRAPKGTKEPIYVERGNSALIDSYFGQATAHYPDLLEAKQFNQNYGLFISAPAGFSNEETISNPYYGGVYITVDGLYNFEKEESALRDEDTGELGPSFIITEAKEMPSTMEKSVDNLLLSIDDADVNNNIDLSYLDKITQSVNVLSKSLLGKNFELTVTELFNFNFINNIKIDILEAIDSDESSTVILTEELFNKIIFEKELFSDETCVNVYNDLLKDLLNSSDSKIVYYKDIVEDIETIYRLTLGASIVSSIVEIRETKNIKDKTLMYLVQKSPTEIPTNIVISSIGYDKYQYDIKVNNVSVIKDIDNTFKISSEDLINVNDNLVFGNVENEDYIFSLGTKLDDSFYQVFDVTEDYITKTFLVEYQDQDFKFIYVENVIDTETPKNIIRELTENGEYPLVLNKNYNTLTISSTETLFDGSITNGGILTGSLNETGLDAQGANIYFGNILPDESFSFYDIRVINTLDNINGIINNSGVFLGNRITSESGIEATAVLKGTRPVAEVVNKNIKNNDLGCSLDFGFIFENSIKDVWENIAMSPDYDEVFIFMDPTGYDSIKELQKTNRINSNKFSTYIAPRSLTQRELLNPSTINVTGRFTGCSQVVNEFLVKDSITSKNFWRKPIGDVGSNYARIIDLRYGAVAPFYYNNTLGLGGQLEGTVLKQKYSFSQTQLKELDTKGLNPIVLNDSGMMLVSQKTTQDPNNLTDWSYLGHSMAFDLIKRTIRDNVMSQQIGKPNDTYYQNLRTSQVEDILKPRLVGNQPLWTAGVVECKTLNTDQVKAQRRFIIKVSVKVTVYSEGVDLVFENVSQTTNIS